MSLSSHLSSKKSANDPVLRFFEEQFPSTLQFVQEQNKRLKGLNTIRLPSGQANHPYSTLGTAIDYRLRYYFAVTPIKKMVAWRGALSLVDHPVDLEWVEAPQHDAGTGFCGVPHHFRYRTHPASQRLSSELVKNFFSSLDEVLTRITPVPHRLERPEEELLARYCFVLALFEQGFRAQVNDNSYLFKGGTRHTVADLLSIVEPE